VEAGWKRPKRASGQEPEAVTHVIVQPPIIALRALDTRGSEILDEFEETTRLQPLVIEDTRYYDTTGPTVWVFGNLLDTIDEQWRMHIAVATP
jgi:hypothetical protein